MSGLSTHVLDTSRGRPAAGIRAILEKQGEDSQWEPFYSGITNDDGRITSLLPAGTPLEPGVYRLTFDTAAYHAQQGVSGFYPEVQIVFQVLDNSQHYHVPLLLSPFGYSTYRGS